MKRVCRYCDCEFDLTNFIRRKNGKDGYSYRCKNCQKLKNEKYRDYRRDYNFRKRHADPIFAEKLKASKKKYRNSSKGIKKESDYRNSHKEERSAYNAQHYKLNKSKKRKQNKEWIKNNPEKYKLIVKRHNAKKITDPIKNLSSRLRCSMYKTYNKLGVTKTGKTFSLLKYTPKQLYEHLKSFENKPCVVCNEIAIQGSNKQLDHIVPLGSAIEEKDIIRLNQLNNLRFICDKCNLAKISSDLQIIKRIKYE